MANQSHFSSPKREELPQYPVVDLKPTTPSFDTRYNAIDRRSKGRQVLDSVIPALTRINTYSFGKDRLPEGWFDFQHPEGATYYVRADGQIVTPVDPRHEGNRALLNNAFLEIVRHLREQAIHDFGPIECFLNISPETPTQVLYYLVDHKNRQIFWVSNLTSRDSSLPAVETFGDIRSVLLPEYWLFLDYYPCHGDFPRDAADELLGILSHGEIDDMTSPGSTCPYGAEECRRYRKCIQNVISTGPDAYKTACVARIWSAVARARHINSYGLDGARLDRLQGLIAPADAHKRKNSKMALLEALLFYLPVGIESRLASLFNGRVVYQRHWQVFFNDMRMNWVYLAAIATFLMIGNVIMMTYGKASFMGVTSALLAGASVFASVYLHQQHPAHSLSTGPEISAYVMRYEDYYQGLRPLAIVLSVPQGLVIYSAIAFHVALISQALHVRHTD